MKGEERPTAQDVQDVVSAIETTTSVLDLLEIAMKEFDSQSPEKIKSVLGILVPEYRERLVTGLVKIAQYQEGRCKCN